MRLGGFWPLWALVACAAPLPADSAAPVCADPPQIAGEPRPSPPGEGVSAAELPSAQALADALLARAGVEAVAWREQGADSYVVQTPTVTARLLRERDAAGDRVLRWELEGAPLPVDPSGEATLATELAAGSNPQGTTYPDHGYGADDPRLAFASAADASFPLLDERVAQLFDSPDAPDLIYLLAPYAAGGMGTHGGASAAQSRAPWIFTGPGVVPGTPDITARSVDIAPTVAWLLGVQPERGVDGLNGREADGLMLRWQDGEVRTELLDPCAYGAADRALIVLFDGLSHTEVLDGIASGRLPNFARVAERGAVLQRGAVVGLPSLSLPGHTSVFTGAWQGHHGLLANHFRHRATDAVVPEGELADLVVNAAAARAISEGYLSPDVETLFEAVTRSFPGETAASVGELTYRGATWSRLLTARTDYATYELADEVSVLEFDRLWDEQGAPKLAAVALYVTDGLGHGEGPHGDALREGMVAVDARLGRMLDRYEAAGLLDSTVVVLTADHGMELQDASRVASTQPAIASTGVAVAEDSRGMLWLR